MVYWSNSKQLEIEDNITIKTALKRAIQKTAEATSDLTGNTIADKNSFKNFSEKEFRNEWKKILRE